MLRGTFINSYASKKGYGFHFAEQSEACPIFYMFVLPVMLLSHDIIQRTGCQHVHIVLHKIPKRYVGQV